MINKQSLWFVTLFSLILVLSIYYVTMSDNSLEKILGNTENTALVSTEVSENKELVALRVKEDEEVLKEMESYQQILLDSTKTSEEKSDAYNSLMTLNTNKGQEQEMEEKIKTEYKLESFVKIKDDNINITVSSKDHSANLANNIIRTIREMCEKKMYITVKFQE